MPKAAYVGQAISYFDPMQSIGPSHTDWFVERPDSPLEILKAFLLNDTTDAKILFSGHRGSGKTSELNRLVADEAVQRKLFIVQFSIKDELNVADLNYIDLLLAIGHRLYSEAEKSAALDEGLKKSLDDWAVEVSRVWSVTDQAAVEVKGGIGAWFLKATGLLRTGYDEKQEFRQKFQVRVPQLIDYINQIIRAVETHPQTAGREVLMILEDLDKPTLDVALDLFDLKGAILTGPQCKIIFTVPTALLYSGRYAVVRENFNPQFVLPNFKIKERSGDKNNQAWSRMREIAERRIDSRLVETQALDRAVEMSGGVVRELVRIMQGAASIAWTKGVNVIKAEHVEHAVGKLRAEYSFSLTREEDIEILRKVKQTGRLIHHDEAPLLRLLHSLLILYYPNDPGWYGVNPIVHELIEA
jgi:hypothetical protein